ncbi:MAG: hypothetical protein FJ051_09220 [Cyanobacteria bacterium M_surface_9_m1_291]|nr:hypothetical protein [Cyanobacteria bacterium K_Offshore_0m_m2_072]MBM5809978.1 hypothetical protein [Cyanobacteria bacterium M_surface_9_m1_291]
MNLIEVIVAASVFLGACSGAAQMGASSAAAMTSSRARTEALEQIEAQLLAVGPLIAAARAEGPAPSSSCRTAVPWLQAQLETGLPPLAPGVQRAFSVDPTGEQVQIAFSAEGGVRRQRLLNPAAYGLCGASAADQQSSFSTSLAEPSDAAL